MIAIFKSGYGACLMGLGRDREAEAVLLESHAYLKERLGSDHAYTVQMVRSLERLYRARGWPMEQLRSKLKSPR